MLTGMKPLPKALIIFLPIALAIGAYVKFAPQAKVEPIVTPIVVPVEAALSIVTTPAFVEPTPIVDNNQNAGMKALLEKGKK